MAQNYEIDIKRFNGQDYDTLLPTPAAHASTHQANGSDPLTLQAGNYGASSIPTSAYQNASVTRAKLAQDALYSPFLGIPGSLTNAHIGRTLQSSWNTSGTVSVSAEDSANIPVGAEFALFRWGNAEVDVTFEVLGSQLIWTTGQTTSAKKVKVSEPFGMIAIKKVSTANGGAWLVTGNVEVVS